MSGRAGQEAAGFGLGGRLQQAAAASEAVAAGLHRHARGHIFHERPRERQPLLHLHGSIWHPDTRVSFMPLRTSPQAEIAFQRSMLLFADPPQTFPPRRQPTTPTTTITMNHFFRSASSRGRIQSMIELSDKSPASSAIILRIGKCVMSSAMGYHFRKFQVTKR